MYKSILECPKCSDIIIKSTEADTKIRSKVLIQREGGCFAVCRGCGVEVLVPLSVDVSSPLLKSVASEASPRLYVDIEVYKKRS